MSKPGIVLPTSTAVGSEFNFSPSPEQWKALQDQFGQSEPWTESDRQQIAAAVTDYLEIDAHERGRPAANLANDWLKHLRQNVFALRRLLLPPPDAGEMTGSQATKVEAEAFMRSIVQSAFGRRTTVPFADQNSAADDDEDILLGLSEHIEGERRFRELLDSLDAGIEESSSYLSSRSAKQDRGKAWRKMIRDLSRQIRLMDLPSGINKETGTSPFTLFVRELQKLFEAEAQQYMFSEAGLTKAIGDARSGREK